MATDTGGPAYPHEGLTSWCMAYAENLMWISNYWRDN